jgi:hypothetical protein
MAGLDHHAVMGRIDMLDQDIGHPASNRGGQFRPARPRRRVASKMQHSRVRDADDTDIDQIDGDDDVEQFRPDQDQDAGDQSDDRLNFSSEFHGDNSSDWDPAGQIGQSPSRVPDGFRSGCFRTTNYLNLVRWLWRLGTKRQSHRTRTLA